MGQVKSAREVRGKQGLASEMEPEYWGRPWLAVMMNY